MSLESRVDALALRVSQEIKAVRGETKEIRILEVGENPPSPLPEGVIFFRKVA